MSSSLTMKDPLIPALADTIGFELLDGALAHDVESTLRRATKAGVLFPLSDTPLAIFRDTVRSAIGRIQKNDRAGLLLRFLKDGPYEDGGEFPAKLSGLRLTDDETAAVTGFIHSHMVNCFKGALMELFAVGPCLDLLRTLQRRGDLPAAARLYLGDTVWSRTAPEAAFAKGADLHLLVLPRSRAAGLVVVGVVEVKSYFKTATSLRRQLAQHLARTRHGLRIGGQTYASTQIGFAGVGGKPVRISVVPSAWRLPRRFRFEVKEGRKFLHVDPPLPPTAADSTEPAGSGAWHVTLRWSKEALDCAAYGLTFWLMEKVGEALYANDGVPSEWAEMTPAQAGQNAAKQALYYAINRARNRRDEQRAIAIYNSYGFGCALGMNFRNAEGRREMLWPSDLDEIIAHGATVKREKVRSPCRIY
jgi:hypothetical protein